MFHFIVLFIAKVIDNALNTTKTIMIQKSRWILAAVAVMLSDFIYLTITKSVVSEGGNVAIAIVSMAGGVGCAAACLVSEKISRDRTYVNVIMSDNRDAMQELRDYLAGHHITNVASDSYTLDWDRKTITITAYAETKEESRLINAFIEKSPQKFKRIIQPVK